MASRSIIDPHIHLWDQRKTPRKASPLVKLLGWHRPTMLWVAERVFPKDLYQFFGKPDYVLSDYVEQHYLADASARELVGFVHVQAGWEGRGPMGPVGETRWLEQLKMPQLKGIVAYADLGLGAAVAPVLAAHVGASQRVRGVRYMLSNHPDPGVHSYAHVADQCRKTVWRRGYEQLAKFGLSFDAWVYHHQLGDMAALASEVPEVPMILCHAGSPVGLAGLFSQTGATVAERDGIDKSWRDGLARLAEQPNVSVKLSGLVMPMLGLGYHLTEPPTAARLVDEVGPLIRCVVDTFGPERCMVASNFPVDKVAAPFATLYDAYDTVLADYGEAEQQAMFHDNAARIYRLELV